MSEQTSLTTSGSYLEPASDLDRVRSKALMAGAVGSILMIAGYFMVDPAVFYRSFLIGWVYWLGISLGLFGICLLCHVSGGRWGIQMRKVQEASGRTVWFFGLLAVPLFCLGGMEYLYPWVRESAATDALVQAKSDYLKLWFEADGRAGLTLREWLVPGFYPRMIFYFVVWTFWAYKMSSLGRRHDETGDEALRVSQQKWSAAGMIVFIMLATFSSIDILMSTDPHWFSSLYGLQMVDWQVLSALAFSVPVMIFLGNRRPLDQLIQKKQYHDYGKLMLALTMIWGYFSVSQFLIIWSGDLPEEVGWYLYRSAEGWKTYTVLLVIACFFVPFLILLSQDIKFKPRVLLRVALLILVTRWFDYYWQVAPNLHHDGISLHWFDFVSPVAIGGLWVWLLFGQMKGRSMLPVADPVVQEALADV